MHSTPTLTCRRTVENPQLPMRPCSRLTHTMSPWSQRRADRGISRQMEVHNKRTTEESGVQSFACNATVYFARKYVHPIQVYGTELPHESTFHGKNKEPYTVQNNVPQLLYYNEMWPCYYCCSTPSCLASRPCTAIFGRNCLKRQTKQSIVEATVRKVSWIKITRDLACPP